MRTPPEDLDERDLVAALSLGWSLDVAGTRYAPLGCGSHHWLADDADGGRHWVTVDDLDQTRFLGETRDAAFDGLRRALDTALALHQGGLEFVVPPVPARGGETVRRLGARHTVAVFPFVDGRAHRSGEPLPPAETAHLVDMLARLHRATPAVASVARRWNPALPARGALERALRDLDREWTGGPFSEPARALLAGRAEGVRRLLGTFDGLVEQVAAAGREPVVTHGEPHPGNLLSAGGRLLLVDWDTVALAPPERDLWMLAAPGGDALAQYAEAVGRQVDEAAVRLFRLRWLLDEVACHVDELRSTHRRTAATEYTWLSLARYLEWEDLAPPRG